MFEIDIIIQRKMLQSERGNVVENMRGSRGAGGPDTPPPLLKNYNNIGCLEITGPDPLKNHIATKPAFNDWQSLARQRNAISMAFRWRADDDPFIVVFGSSIPTST